MMLLRVQFKITDFSFLLIQEMLLSNNNNFYEKREANADFESKYAFNVKAD